MDNRETLNDRYICKGLPQDSWLGFTMPGFTGWYLLDFNLKNDGLNNRDFGYHNVNGKPVMYWKDNRSIYVDHKP